VRFTVAIFAAGLHGRLLFAIVVWGAMSLPIILESALFIRASSSVNSLIGSRPRSWLASSQVVGCDRNLSRVKIIGDRPEWHD